MKIMTTAATLAALLVSAGTAIAAPAVPGTNPMQPAAVHTAQPAARRNQAQSNENIRIARRHVERAIDGLQRDATDYGGHKERAIDDLQTARQDLDSALDFAASHGNGQGTGVALPGGNGDAGLGGMRNQGPSNENIVDVRQNVEAAIDALQRDNRDYGGNKERAIDKLQAARGELEAALDFAAHNRGVRTGGTGQAVSDANLRFVDSHVRAAIDQLQEDRHDYGGHRASAVSDLDTAADDIASALAFDRRSEPGTNGAPGVLHEGSEPTGAMTQGTSNSSLMAARQHVETAMDALNRDAHDYGGFRVKAIAALRAAREQILLALQFQRAH